jgi:hypothetical protein
MDTARKIVIHVPPAWYEEALVEAHQRRVSFPELLREKLGCGEVRQGRPAFTDEERQRKVRVMVGFVLQEAEMRLKGEKLIPGVGIEPQVWCAKRDLAKLGLYDPRTQFLKLQETPFEDLQPLSPAAPQAMPLKKDLRRG